jgi:hypothetical protein
MEPRNHPLTQTESINIMYILHNQLSTHCIGHPASARPTGPPIGTHYTVLATVLVPVFTPTVPQIL